MKTIERRGFVALLFAVAAGTVIPRSTKALPGDEQYQMFVDGEFNDCLWDDISEGDIVRQARNPDTALRVNEIHPDASPPGIDCTTVAIVHSF